MAETTLFVEKDTDQMRSTLVASALASLLFHLAEAGSGVDVRIVDQGSAYRLQVNGNDRAVLLDFVRQRGLPPLLPAILKPLSAKEKKLVEGGVPEDNVLRKYKPRGFPLDRVVNYGAEKQKVDAARQARRQKTREEGDAPIRPRDYPLWAHLCSYFGKGSAMRIGYPLVVHAWHAHQGECAEALCELILQAYGDFPNRLDEARD